MTSFWIEELIYENSINNKRVLSIEAVQCLQMIEDFLFVNVFILSFGWNYISLHSINSKLIFVGLTLSKYW